MKAVLFFGLFLLAMPGFGQKITALKLDNKQAVLNGKAFFQFPKEAKNIARSANIMGPDPNEDKETRIMFDIGNQRLVFFAEELYITSDDNLVAKLTKDNSRYAIVKPLTGPHSLLAAIVTPTTFDSTANAILINRLFVRMPDKTVFSLGVYINPDAFKNKEEFQQLSEKIFASVTKGDRILDFSAKKENLPIIGSKKKFSLALPEGYVVTKDKGPDFEVLRFQRVRDIADTNWSSFMIYTGFHPSYFYRDYGFTDKDIIATKGSVLGQKIEWMAFKNVEKKMYLKEQHISADHVQKGLVFHIAISGSSLQEVDELAGIAEKIKVID